MKMNYDQLIASAKSTALAKKIVEPIQSQLVKPTLAETQGRKIPPMLFKKTQTIAPSPFVLPKAQVAKVTPIEPLKVQVRQEQQPYEVGVDNRTPFKPATVAPVQQEPYSATSIKPFAKAPVEAPQEPVDIVGVFEDLKNTNWQRVADENVVTAQNALNSMKSLATNTFRAYYSGEMNKYSNFLPKDKVASARKQVDDFINPINKKVFEENQLRRNTVASIYAGKGQSDMEKNIIGVTTGIVDMVPMIVANYVVPYSGLAVMFGNVSEAEYRTALADGATEENALTYGLLKGGIEVGTELIAGGASLANKAGLLDAIGLKKFVTKHLGGIAEDSMVHWATTLAGKKFVSQAIDIFGEGAEEYISEVLGSVVVKTYKETGMGVGETLWNSAKSKQAFDAWGMGMLTSAVLSMETYAVGKSLQTVSREKKLSQLTAEENMGLTKLLAEKFDADLTVVSDQPNMNGMYIPATATKRAQIIVNDRSLQPLGTVAIHETGHALINSTKDGAQIVKDFLGIYYNGKSLTEDFSKLALKYQSYYDETLVMDKHGITKQELDALDETTYAELIKSTITDFAKERRVVTSEETLEELFTQTLERVIDSPAGMRRLIGNEKVSDRIRSVLSKVGAKMAGDENASLIQNMEEVFNLYAKGYKQAVDSDKKQSAEAVKKQYEPQTDLGRILATVKVPNKALARASVATKQNKSVNDMAESKQAPTGLESSQAKYSIADFDNKERIDIPKVTAKPFTDEFMPQMEIRNKALVNLIESNEAVLLKDGNYNYVISPSLFGSKYQVTNFNGEKLLGDGQYDDVKSLVQRFGLSAEVVSVIEKQDAKPKYSISKDPHEKYDLDGVTLTGQEILDRYNSGELKNISSKKDVVVIFNGNGINDRVIGIDEKGRVFESSLYSTEIWRDNHGAYDVKFRVGTKAYSYWDLDFKGNPEIEQKAKLSLSEDTKGRKLTKEQQEFFKDTKVVDEEGKLSPVYHGTNSDFNEFKLTDTLGNNGTAQGYGYYFTSDINTAKNYYGKNVKEVYLDIKNPLSFEEQTMTQKQKDFIVDNYSKKIENLIDEQNRSGIENNISAYQFAEKYDKVSDELFITNMIKNALYYAKDSDSKNTRLFITPMYELLKKEYGYDGFTGEKLHGVKVAWFADQIKYTDNLNPTASKDMRYSLSYDQNRFLNRVTNIDIDYSHDGGIYIQARNSQGNAEYMSSQSETEESLSKMVGDELANEIIYGGKKRISSADINTYTTPIDYKGMPMEEVKKVVSDAVKSFGLTNDFREAGYLTVTGKLLDFSGKRDGGRRGQRAEDHREIRNIGFDMTEFMDMGNIRMKPEADGFEVSKVPTKEQKAVLRQYIARTNGEVYVDLAKGEYDTEGVEYTEGTSATKIFNDIEAYFETGKIPNQSDINKYRYSLAEETKRKISNNEPLNIEEKTQQLADAGFDVKYSISDTKDLVALHNLTEDKLLGLLELGGIPVPSIAIIKDTMKHDNFGDITLVMKPDVVDPAKSPVFSADAYSPRFPDIYAKPDMKKLKEAIRYFQAYDGYLNERNYEKTTHDEAVYMLSREMGVKKKYLIEKGIEYKTEVKPYRSSGWGITSDLMDLFIKQNPEFEGMNIYNLSSKEIMAKYGDKTIELVKNALMKDGVIGETEANYFVKDFGFSQVDGTLSEVQQYVRDSKRKEVVDTYKTQANINNAIKPHEEDFTNWVSGKLEGVYGDKVIVKPNTDPFYPDGSRKPISATTIPATLDNLVKILKNKGKLAGEEEKYGQGVLNAVLSTQFKSKADLKNNVSRLTDEKTFNKKAFKINEEYISVNNKLANSNKSRFSQSVFEAQSILTDYVKDTGKDRLSAEGVMNYMNKWNYNVDLPLANKIMDLYKNLQQLPTKYFEAKPQRAVSFSEVNNIIIPESASQKLKTALESAGLTYVTYKDGQSRSEIIKYMSSAKFMLSDDQVANLEHQYSVKAQYKPIIDEMIRSFPEDIKETDRGLEINVVRYQKQAQEGQLANRNGVFYMAKPRTQMEGDTYSGDAKYKRYGGDVKFEGKIVAKRPLLIEGNTGGEIPMAVIRQYAKKMNYPTLLQEISSDSDRIFKQLKNGENYPLYEIAYMLETHAGLSSDQSEKYADELIKAYTVKGASGTEYIDASYATLAIKEFISAELAKKMGYDVTIGYQKPDRHEVENAKEEIRKVDIEIAKYQETIEQKFGLKIEDFQDVNTELENMQDRLRNAKNMPVLEVGNQALLKRWLFEINDNFSYKYHWEEELFYLQTTPTEIIDNRELTYPSKTKESLVDPRFVKKVEIVDAQRTAGFDVKYSISDTKDLVALHNLTEDKLLGLLELGGIPVPSIAILKADMEHDDFGEITLVMKPDVVNPKKSPVFTADVYSPRFPKVMRKNVEAEAKELRTFFYRLKKEAISNGTYDSRHDRVRDEIANLFIELNDGKIDLKMNKWNPSLENLALTSYMKDYYEKETGDMSGRNIKSAYDSMEHREKVMDFIIKKIEPALGGKYIQSSDGENLPYTLKNVAKVLKGKIVGEEADHGQGVLNAVLARQFENKKDLKNNKDRLVDEQTFEKKAMELTREYKEILNMLAVTNSGYFRESDDASIWINDYVKGVGKDNITSDSFIKFMEEQDYIVTPEFAKSILNYFKKLQQLPTKYFEAKPQRAVSFSEVYNIIIPESSSNELKTALDKKGLTYISYNDYESRSELIQNMNDAKFSISDEVSKNAKATQEKFTDLEIPHSYEDVSADWGKYKRRKIGNTAGVDSAKVEIMKDSKKLPTKDQWLAIARKAGENLNAKTSKELTEYAWFTWFDKLPSYRGNFNRQGEKQFVARFGVDEWIKAIYEGAGVIDKNPVVKKSRLFGRPKPVELTTDRALAIKQEVAERIQADAEANKVDTTELDIRNADFEGLPVSHFDPATENILTWMEENWYEPEAETNYETEPAPEGAESVINPQDYETDEKGNPIDPEVFNKMQEQGIIEAENKDTDMPAPEAPIIKTVSEAVTGNKPSKPRAKKVSPVIETVEQMKIEYPEVSNYLEMEAQLRERLQNEKTDTKEPLAVQAIRNRVIGHIKQGDMEKLGIRKHEITIAESGVIGEEQKTRIAKEVLAGKFDYVIASDKKALQHADAELTLGKDDAYTRLIAKIQEGKEIITKNDIAVGERLLVEYGHDKTKWRETDELAQYMAMALTQAGQTVQAGSLINKMDAYGQLMTTYKIVAKLERDYLKTNKKGKLLGIVIDEKLIQNLLAIPSSDKKGIADAMDAIKQNIADQILPSFGEKVNAWRYLSMLGNPRTHIRNIVGNATALPLVWLRDPIGVLIEQSIPKDQRTKAILLPSIIATKQGKAIYDFVKADWAETSKLMDHTSKYDMRTDIEQKKTVFKTVWLEKLRTLNFDWLEAEDNWFKKIHYVRSMAQYMTAKGLTAETISETQLKEARTHAVKESLKMTYQDASAFASMMNTIEKNGNIFVRVAMSAVLPFKKTPVNILKRGLEFSPVALVTVVPAQFMEYRKGNISQSDLIDSLSAGLSGTGVALLGFFLQSAGIISIGGGSGDKKKDEFDLMNGIQDFSINVAGMNFTIDWAIPTVLPMFVGAQISRIMEDKGISVFDANTMLPALTSVFNPVFEMSMLQGVMRMMQSYNPSGAGVATDAISNIVESYGGQFVPTLSGQLARIIDQTRRSTYAPAESPITPALETFLRRIANKIPLASFLNAPMVNARGEELKQNDNLIIRALESLVSPAYSASTKVSPEDRALIELFDLTKDSAVLPKIATKSFTNEGTKYVLDNKEYAQFAKTMGTVSYELLKKLTQNETYKILTATDKAKLVNELYEYARAKAQAEYLAGKQVAVSNKAYLKIASAEGYGVSAVDYTLAKFTYDSLSDTVISKKNAFIIRLVDRGFNYEKIKYLLTTIGGYKITDADYALLKERLQARK